MYVEILQCDEMVLEKGSGDVVQRRRGFSVRFLMRKRGMLMHIVLSLNLKHCKLYAIFKSTEFNTR